MIQSYTLAFLTLFITFMASSQLKEDALLDNWHKSAAQANFEDYFKVTTNDFVFLGTAPGERWTKEEFKSFCKPYFDKGQAWDFKPSNRNWIYSKNKKIAWFDEDLSTWMEGCRGSGIIVKEKGVWKIAYYNLTVLIENEKIKEFIELRKLIKVEPNTDPEFPGGTNAMKQYISKNITYPQSSLDNGEQGSVYVKFCINIDGSITDIVVERGVSSDLDREAKRLIKNMPNWIPAKENGVPIKTCVRLPISFSLQ